MSAVEAMQLEWLPPKSKVLQIYSTNVSSVTINPKIGYRHKLLNVAINGIAGVMTPTNMTREAIDIVLGAKTMVRYPAWMWGNSIPDIAQYSDTADVSLPWFLTNWVTKGITDLLPDAAQDEPLTISAISGNTYPVIGIRYAEYPSEQAAAHDVPGGSDYWRKYFVAWFYLMSTTVGSGQQLTEAGEPFGLSLLGSDGLIPPNRHFRMFTLESGYQNALENSSITNYTVYNALHVWKNDEELFTPDTHVGLYINQQNSGGQTDTTNSIFNDWRRNTDFNPSDRLSLYADVTSVTGSGSPLWVLIDGILEDLSKKPATAGGP